MTKYQLSWGAPAVVSAESRLFTADERNDAVTRFAERVVELDRHPEVSSGWVSLKQIDRDWSIGWTKTSDERPTSEGS